MSAILVVEDDAAVRDMIAEILRAENYEAATASNGREALALLGMQCVDLIITDLIMPQMDGVETIAEVRRSGGRLPIIAITGGGWLGPADYLETARHAGADATLAKPFSRQALLDMVEGLLVR